MDFNALVSVALGVLAIIILFSLAASAIQESIVEYFWKLRAGTLEDGIRTLLRAKHLGTLVAPFTRQTG